MYLPKHKHNLVHNNVSVLTHVPQKYRVLIVEEVVWRLTEYGDRRGEYRNSTFSSVFL